MNGGTSHVCCTKSGSELAVWDVWNEGGTRDRERVAVIVYTNAQLNPSIQNHSQKQQTVRLLSRGSLCHLLLTKTRWLVRSPLEHSWLCLTTAAVAVSMTVAGLVMAKKNPYELKELFGDLKSSYAKCGAHGVQHDVQNMMWETKRWARLFLRSDLNG